MGERLIFYGPFEHFDEAARIVREELTRFHRYDRIGWGWSFRSSSYPETTFFVRRIKDGLSITATPRALTITEPSA
ncbi:MAG: hypothetical protein J7521_20130 [Caulobacter sp.]|nr:hypothetical protein [Caulobacter sp.]